MDDTSPYRPPQQDVSDGSPRQLRTPGSRRPDLIALGLGGVAWIGGGVCAFSHSCMCGHLAHQQSVWATVPVDVAVFLSASFAAGALLLARTTLRFFAALCLLALLPTFLRELGMLVALIGLVCVLVSAIRGRGPDLTFARG